MWGGSGVALAGERGRGGHGCWCVRLVHVLRSWCMLLAYVLGS